MKVIIGEAASADLDEIYAWIAKDRPSSADPVMTRIFSALDLLAEFPRVGHRGRVRGTYEWVVRGLPYVIVYEIDDDASAVTIIGVFHGARERRRR